MNLCLKISLGKEGTLDCKLHWYPKFYNHTYLLVGLKTLGTFIWSNVVNTDLPVVNCSAFQVNMFSHSLAKKLWVLLFNPDCLF